VSAVACESAWISFEREGSGDASQGLGGLRLQSLQMNETCQPVLHVLVLTASASHALAEARREAAQHGKERREHIRRRVREAEVIRELERVQLAGGVNGGSGRA
jgi:hypothetical protein